MKSKKLLSLVMATAVAASLAVPAFAAEGGGDDADTETKSNQTEITATYTEPVIDVAVPQSAAAVINPLKLPVKFLYDDNGALLADQTDTENAASTITVEGSAIATQPMAVVNYGESTLDVAAMVTINLPETSEIKISTTASGVEKLTTKSMYLVLEAVSGGAPDEAGIDPTTGEIASLSSLWSSLDWTKAVTAVGSAKPLNTTKLGTLTGKDAETQQVTGTLAVRLNGAVAQSPKTPWAATDTFTTTVAYTFTPAAATNS